MKTLLTILIAMVWLINGLFCKILNMVPRHQQIVGRILGVGHATFLTKLIGISEVLMAIWVVSRIKTKLCTITQIVIVVLMNIIEFILAPDLLLFGHINLFVAIVFVTIIYFNTFVIQPVKA